MADATSVLRRKTTVRIASETREYVKLAQSCPTLGDPVEYTVHGIPPGQNTGVGRTCDASPPFLEEMLRLSLGSHSIPGNTCIIISSSHHVGRGTLWAQNKPRTKKQKQVKWGVCGFVGTNVKTGADGVLKKTGYDMQREQEIKRCVKTTNRWVNQQRGKKSSWLPIKRCLHFNLKCQEIQRS